MKAVAFVGRIAALFDGKNLYAYHIPGKHVRAILFDRFAPDCLNAAANDAGS